MTQEEQDIARLEDDGCGSAIGASAERGEDGPS